jgi:hypothetical protein
MSKRTNANFYLGHWTTQAVAGGCGENVLRQGFWSFGGGIRLPTLRSLRRLHFQEQKRVPRCCTYRAAPAALQFGRRTLKLRAAFMPAQRCLPRVLFDDGITQPL